MLCIKIKHFSKKSVSQYTYGLSSQPHTPTNQFKFLLCRKKRRKVSTHGARRYVSPEQYGIETHWVSVNFCEKISFKSVGKEGNYKPDDGCFAFW